MCHWSKGWRLSKRNWKGIMLGLKESSKKYGNRCKQYKSGLAKNMFLLGGKNSRRRKRRNCSSNILSVVWYLTCLFISKWPSLQLSQCSFDEPFILQWSIWHWPWGDGRDVQVSNMTGASRWNSSTSETNLVWLTTKWDVGVPAGPAQAVRGIWARWSRLRTISVSRSRLQQLKRWRNTGGLAWFPWPDLNPFCVGASLWELHQMDTLGFCYLQEDRAPD